MLTSLPKIRRCTAVLPITGVSAGDENSTEPSQAKGRVIDFSIIVLLNTFAADSVKNMNPSVSSQFFSSFHSSTLDLNFARDSNLSFAEVLVYQSTP